MTFEQWWGKYGFSHISKPNHKETWIAAQQAERESHAISIAEQANIICGMLEERAYFLS